MERLIREILENNKKYADDGVVADYIPMLANRKKDEIGFCVRDEKGIYAVGDCEVKFTIQSISKVISLMIAIMENGEEYVFERVGYEGTDEAFNSGYKLDLPHVDKPANPMINSGAILTTSLIQGSEEEKIEKILNMTRFLAENDDIHIDEETYLSEKATGNKNRALAYQMKARGMIEGDVEANLDTYFKQCSIEVTAKDLANIGYFFAKSGETLGFYGQVERKRLMKIIIGIMNNCGMYNYSSRYGIEVGLPSKSGVGGGIMAILPNEMGIASFCPGLDENGNSLVGIKMLQEFSNRMDCNIYIK